MTLDNLTVSCLLFEIYISRHSLRLSHVQPLTVLQDDEIALVDSVNKLCQDVVVPRIKEMDQKSEMSKEIIKALFKAGVSIHYYYSFWVYFVAWLLIIT